MKAFTIPKDESVVPGVRVSDIPEGAPFTGRINNTTSVFVVLEGSVYDLKALTDGSFYIDTDADLVGNYKPVSLTISVK